MDIDLGTPPVKNYLGETLRQLSLFGMTMTAMALARQCKQIWDQTTQRLTTALHTRPILTTATLKGTISWSAAIKVTVINLGLVFDLHSYYLVGDHSFKSHHSRAFFQRVNEDTYIKYS